MKLKEYSYVLITPARNEEAYIEKPIQSVIAQSVLPQKWVIVSDNSTDHTDDIVRSYAERYDFINLVRIDGYEKRDFNAKVRAFNIGYQELENIGYDFLGILDADVSFGSDYYQSIFSKFETNDRLGIAGGVRFDWYKEKFIKVLCARDSVGGPFQLFRRKCFEDIGGFRPQKIGGEDAIAETMARMHNWEVQSFPEIKVYHHRHTGTAAVNVLRASFCNGIKTYLLGYSPLFQIARCIYRVNQVPYILGSLLSSCGYLWACLNRYHRDLPDDFFAYLRSEQAARLKSYLQR